MKIVSGNEKEERGGFFAPRRKVMLYAIRKLNFQRVQVPSEMRARKKNWNECDDKNKGKTTKMDDKGNALMVERECQVKLQKGQRKPSPATRIRVKCLCWKMTLTLRQAGEIERSKLSRGISEFLPTCRSICPFAGGRRTKLRRWLGRDRMRGYK